MALILFAGSTSKIFLKHAAHAQTLRSDFEFSKAIYAADPREIRLVSSKHESVSRNPHLKVSIFPAQPRRPPKNPLGRARAH